MRKPRTLGHTALLSSYADAHAVLPLLSHATTSPTQAFLSFFHGSENLRASCGQRLVEVLPFGRDHGTAADREKGPPLDAFCLAPHQRENQGYSERNHDYGESQQIEHEHLPWLAGDFQDR